MKFPCVMWTSVLFVIWNFVIFLMGQMPHGGALGVRWWEESSVPNLLLLLKNLLPNVVWEGKGWQICKWELTDCEWVFVHPHALPPPLHPSIALLNEYYEYLILKHILLRCHLHSGSKLWCASQENNVWQLNNHSCHLSRINAYVGIQEDNFI